MITAVKVGSECGFMFSAQNTSYFGRHATKHEVLCVDNEPFPFDFTSFWGIGTRDASTSRDFGNVNLCETRRGTQVEWPGNKATGVVLKRQTLVVSDLLFLSDLVVLGVADVYQGKTVRRRYASGQASIFGDEHGFDVFR